MPAGDLLLSFPMYALANEAERNAATGMIKYRGFHARVADVRGTPESCLMLFATEDSARQYAAQRAGWASASVASITDKMELETVLADCRLRGVELAMIATGMPQQGVVGINDLARGLDALD